jgi:hypothetical protein
MLVPLQSHPLPVLDSVLAQLALIALTLLVLFGGWYLGLEYAPAAEHDWWPVRLSPVTTVVWAVGVAGALEIASGGLILGVGLRNAIYQVKTPILMLAGFFVAWYLYKRFVKGPDIEISGRN